jgi:aryl-alcohol dehydrogenase-like predicted oxidoreductase
VDKVAEAHNASVSQVALAWLLHQPVITSPIIGARTLEQLEDNLGGASLEITDEEFDTLSEISRWND